MEKVNTVAEINKYGTRMALDLAVDGVGQCYGRVPALEEIKKMIG